jgi:hypothetical protein
MSPQKVIAAWTPWALGPFPIGKSGSGYVFASDFALGRHRRGIRARCAARRSWWREKGPDQHPAQGTCKSTFANLKFIYSPGRIP